MKFYDATKRIFDVAVSSFSILIFLPFVIIISILIKLGSKGPVFFVQERVGKAGRIFKIFKFRTMIDGAAFSGKLVTDSNDSRVTGIGRFLRKYKLDEMPQFFNVFKGEMSVVGPRPEVPKYVNYYTEEQKMIVFSVKPGAMGPATLDYMEEEKIVAGNENVEETYIKKILPAKLVLDIDYIKTRTFERDFELFLKNLFRIFIK